MAKIATNVSGAMLLPNLVQVTESISGSVVPLAMFYFAPVILALIIVGRPQIHSQIGRPHCLHVQVQA